MKKIMKKMNRIMAFLLVAMMLFMQFPASVFADAKVGQVKVIVENTTYPEEKGAPWDGVLVDKWVDIDNGSTMMTAVVDALDSEGYEQEGAGNNYISSVNGLEESDGGSESGWMGTLNDWFANQGFDAFTVKNGTLEDGDEVRIMYTIKGYGEDLGGSWSNNDKSLKALRFDKGTWNPKFDKNTKEYTLTLPAGTKNVLITPTAANKNFQVRTSAEGVEYKRARPVPVKNGTEIIIKCGDPSWPSMNDSESPAETYKVNVKIEGADENRIPNRKDSVKESASVDVTLGQEYNLDLSAIFEDQDGDPLTYTVSVDGAQAAAAREDYQFVPDEAGTHTLVFKANDGQADSADTYTVSITATEDTKDYKITADNDAIENGTIEVRTETGKFNEEVTVTLHPDEGYEMKSLKIKDASGRDVSRRQDEEDMHIFCFHMPASDVTIDAEFASSLKYSIGLSKDYTIGSDSEGWPVSVMPECILTNSEGNRVDWDENHSGGYDYYIPEGVYQYKIINPYHPEKIAAQGSLEVHKENQSENSKAFCEFQFRINSTKLKREEGLNGGAYITLYDPDGTEIEEIDHKVESFGENPGYREQRFLAEAYRDQRPYRYTVKPADSSAYANEEEGTVQYYSNSPSRRQVSVPLAAEKSEFTFTVNKDANPKIYKFPDVAYAPMDPLEPIREEDTGDRVTYTYETVNARTANYIYVAGGEGTKYEKQVISQNFIPEITMNLNPSNDKREEYSSRSIVDDIYTNIEDDGNYLPMEVGETFDLKTFRVKQTTGSSMSNVFIDPDKHYEVVAGNSVELSKEKGKEGQKYVTITAKREGVSFVKVTYDSLDQVWFTGRRMTRYNPIDPVYTGFVIVNVGGDSGDIDANLTLPTNAPDADTKTLTKYDTVYFKGKTTNPDGSVEEGKGSVDYTFKPESSEKMTVSAHDPYQMQKSFADDTWTDHGPGKDGSYTIPLKEGRNIIRITTENYSRYYLITAVESDITIANKTHEGKNIKQGDEVSIAFSDLRLPVQKMTAIYNPGFPDNTYITYKLNGEDKIGERNQYVVENEITFTAENAGKYRFHDADIYGAWLGSGLYSECNIPDEGLPPNFNAGSGMKYPYFSVLPDVDVNVEAITTVNPLPRPVSTIIQETKDYMLSIDKAPAKGSEWFALGLARSGMDLDDPYFATYYDNLVEYLKQNNGVLHKRKYTEYSKTILAVTAMGKDARNVGGYNLLKPLADFNGVKNQGLNGPIWALIALNSHPDYEIPKADGDVEQTTEETLIQFILGRQLEDGGWNLSGEKADSDMTGMALQSLAPYYRKADNEEITQAVDRGLDCLANMQNEAGGFGSMGVETSESNAQVLTALTALGVDPRTDARFIKNGKWTVENLVSYHVDGSGFMHVKAGSGNNGGAEAGTVDGMSTEQGFYSLVAYQRFLDGKTSLYDMSDIERKADPGKEPEDPGKEPEDPGKTPEDPGKKPKDPGEDINLPSDKPGAPNTPSGNDDSGKGSGLPASLVPVAKTGDDTPVVPLAIVMLAAAGGIVMLRRKRNSADNN